MSVFMDKIIISGEIDDIWAVIAPGELKSGGREAEPQLEGEYLEIITSELYATASYRNFAENCKKGNSKKCFLELSREKEKIVRSFAAAYYIMTGERACVKTAKLPKTPTSAAVRESIIRETELAGRYALLGQKPFPGDARELFAAAAKTAEKAAGDLRGVLQDNIKV